MKSISPFYVCAVKKAVLSKVDNQKTKLDVYLDKNDFIDPRPLGKDGMSKNPWLIKLTARKNPSRNFVKKQLSLLNKTGSVKIADEKHPIRWLGAGVLLIIESMDRKKYAVLNKRHSKSVWGNYLGDNGGYSSSLEEMLHPKNLAQRELSEEITGINKNKLEEVFPKHPTDVVVHYNNKTFKTNNMILTVDDQSGTIDLRMILKMKVKKIEEFKPKDKETMFINQSQEVLQERPILLVELSKLDEYKNRFNPVLKSDFDSL